MIRSLPCTAQLLVLALVAQPQAGRQHSADARLRLSARRASRSNGRRHDRRLRLDARRQIVRPSRTSEDRVSPARRGNSDDAAAVLVRQQGGPRNNQASARAAGPHHIARRSTAGSRLISKCNNACGASNALAFHVGSVPEVVEPQRHLGPIDLPSLRPSPTVGSRAITEIDEYRFTATAPGMITVKLEDRVGQPFNGRAQSARRRGQRADRRRRPLGTGLELGFVAEAGKRYVAARQRPRVRRRPRLRLSLVAHAGPRAVTTIPLVAARGKSTPSRSSVGA